MAAKISHKSATRRPSEKNPVPLSKLQRLSAPSPWFLWPASQLGLENRWSYQLRVTSPFFIKTVKRCQKSKSICLLLPLQSFSQKKYTHFRCFWMMCLNQATLLGIFKRTDIKGGVKSSKQWSSEVPRFGACHSLWGFFPRHIPSAIWIIWWRAILDMFGLFRTRLETAWSFLGSLIQFGGWQNWPMFKCGLRCANKSMADLMCCPTSMLVCRQFWVVWTDEDSFW